jgi:hypothetical protein
VAAAQGLKKKKKKKNKVYMHDIRIFIDHVHMKARAQEKVMKHGFPSL